jgi:ABC-type transport system substrate-binding protein/DNA-binding SARP family transcriptional activator
MSGSFEFGILGPLEVRRNGETIGIPPGKPRALLAILLTHHGEVVSVDRLVDELWGERPPPTAAKNVQVYVARLRKLLGEGLLVTSAPGYALRIEDGGLDAVRFQKLVESARHQEPSVAAEQLREALALWRGPPLADFSYDSFAQEEIRRLEELRLAALEDRIEADLALGRNEEIVGELDSLVRAHPLRERLQAQLLLALYRCGRQADALAAYQTARSRFVEELGLEPSPPLQELERAILRHDPALAPPGRTNQAAPTERNAPRRSALDGKRGGLLAITGALVLALVAALVAVRLSGGSRALAAPPDSVGMIDGRHDVLRAVVTEAGIPGGIASGAGAVWVTDTAADVVLRIDPARRSAERIPVGHGPTGVALGDGQIWVVNQLDRTVSEVNPSALKQVEKIEVGNGADAIASGLGSVWVANTTDHTISRILAGSSKVVATVELGADVPEGIAAGKHGVWVTSSTGQLLFVDAGSNRVTQAYAIGNSPRGVAVGDGSVWVANSAEGTISRFDPGNPGRLKKILVGNSPSGVAYGNGAVWVANSLDGTVSRIDPSKDSVQEVRVGNEPTALAITDTHVWATVLPSPASHRGGTLRVLREPTVASLGDSADPAGWRGSFSQWQMLSLTNDGLVTYRRLGGLAGNMLVPDLATSLPAPTNGGRTYTFELRSGIRYSNGDLVEPHDFRRAIERVFRLPAPTQFRKQARNFIRSFYTGIVGGKECKQRPAQCDLRRGIVADDGARSVAFHLTAADPDFLYKLAFPMADAVPSDTPGHDIGRTPLPATGPYMTRSFSPGHTWKLVRNPHFRVWSQDAQPYGYPDRIVLRTYTNPRKAVSTIEHGTTDVLPSVPSNSVGELATRYANQLHSDPFAGTYAFVMNTRVPPFDHLDVRRALNYAIDRGRIVAFNGGSLTAQPTCQILPPTVPGYQPYCPYTVDPNSSGSWTAPDVAKADQLIGRSGTRGMRVTVLVDSSEPTGKIGPYAVSVLDRLGYRASLKVVPTVFPGLLPDSRARAQIGWFTWLQDHPSPSNFIDALLSCRAFVPNSQFNPNVSEFCRRKIDAQIRHAYGLQASDPAAADDVWSRLDHELVEQAPWVPLYNPRALTALSTRVGNYQYHPFWRVLLDQLWVR